MTLRRLLQNLRNRTSLGAQLLLKVVATEETVYEFTHGGGRPPKHRTLALALVRRYGFCGSNAYVCRCAGPTAGNRRRQISQAHRRLLRCVEFRERRHGREILRAG